MLACYHLCSNCDVSAQNCSACIGNSNLSISHRNLTIFCECDDGYYTDLTVAPDCLSNY